MKKLFFIPSTLALSISTFTFADGESQNTCDILKQRAIQHVSASLAQQDSVWEGPVLTLDPINQSTLDSYVQRHQGSIASKNEPSDILLINPLLGHLDASGRLHMPGAVDIATIKKYLKAFERVLITGVPFDLDINTIATPHASDEISSTEFKQKFTDLAFLAWKDWIETHSLPDIEEPDSNNHPILSGDKDVQFVSCNGKPLFKEGSSGHSIFSILTRAAKAYGLDPSTLNMMELINIGLGYEYYQNYLSKPTQSIYLQAALHFAHKNNVININQGLTELDVKKALIKFEREYDASILHTDATDYISRGYLEQKPPTPESVGRKILSDNGFNPDAVYTKATHPSYVPSDPHSHGIYAGGNVPDQYEKDGSAPLIDFYLGRNGAHGYLVYEFMEGSGDNRRRYYQLPDPKQTFLDSMTEYRTSAAYTKYKQAIALYSKSKLTGNAVYTDDLVEFVLNNSYAHAIKIIKYGKAQQALMYFNPDEGKHGRHVLVATQNNELKLFDFENREGFKSWLKEGAGYETFDAPAIADVGAPSPSVFHFGQNARLLRNQFMGIKNDYGYIDYLKDFVYDDNYYHTGFLGIFGGKTALDFIPIKDQDPFAYIFDLKLDYLQKIEADTISGTTEWTAFFEYTESSLKTALGFIPIIGQGAVGIWDLEEGNTDAAIFDFGFMAFDLLTTINFSPTLFDGILNNQRRLADKTSEIVAESVNSEAFEFSNATRSRIEDRLDEVSHFPIRQEDGSYHFYFSENPNDKHELVKTIEVDGEHFLVKPSEDDPNIYLQVDAGPYDRVPQLKDSYFHFEYDANAVPPYRKVNRFAYLAEGDRPVLWQHPKTQQNLYVVRLSDNGKLVALVEEPSAPGVFRQVDFESGEVLQEQPFVERKTSDTTAEEYEEANYQCAESIGRVRRAIDFGALCPGGVVEVPVRRQIKLEVLDRLTQVVRIGNAGVITLDEDQMGQIAIIMADLLDHSSYEARITREELEDVLKNAKGFNTALKEPNISNNGAQNFYEYLQNTYCQGGDCNQGIVKDISEWIKKFTAAQRRGLKPTLSSEIADRVVNAMDEAERAGHALSEARGGLPPVPQNFDQAKIYLKRLARRDYPDDKEGWEAIRDLLADQIDSTQVTQLQFEDMFPEF